jgi:hypothetical protein
MEQKRFSIGACFPFQCLLLIVMLSITGCGLNRVPYTRTLPSPLAFVRIVDAQSGDNIPDADVAAWVWKFESAVRGFPAIVGDTGRAPSDALRVLRSPDQSFFVVPKAFQATASPWGTGPLGPTFYMDYGLTIQGKAAGYQSVQISYYPERPVTPKELLQHPKDGVSFDARGDLVLGLELKGNETAPSSHFFGLGGNAFRIVFIVDGSGSLINEFGRLRAELRKAIKELQPEQSFSVIFCNDHNPRPVSPNLLAATFFNKQKMFDWMDHFTPSGGTDPLPAWETAVAMQPQLIFFLADPSCFPDSKKIEALLKNAQVKRKMRINMIALDGHDHVNETWFKKIATGSGGVYKYLSAIEVAEETDVPKP